MAKTLVITETDRQLNMAMLALAQDPRAIFIGQNVAYDGNVVYKHLEGIPAQQRLELPVCEELQMGMSIGLALQGFLPISIYPRLDFLMLAMNQLVNHLDKLSVMSQGQYKPKVIIRTKLGTRWPLDAGPQHTQDHTAALQSMLKSVLVFKVHKLSSIVPIYQTAYALDYSSLIVEALD